MELLRDGVLPRDSVGDGKALRVTREESEMVIEPLPLMEMLGESDSDEHWLTVGEAVAEWQPLGVQERLPGRLCAGDSVSVPEGVPEAYGEDDPQRVALGLSDKPL